MQKTNVEQSVRILVVDDHALVREAIMGALRSHAGFHVLDEDINNGAEAIGAVPYLRPDVVLMDLFMPEIDGLEATRVIKENYPEIEVIILTYLTNEDFVVRAILSGASGYVSKNVNIAELVKDLHSVLKGENVLDPKAVKAVMEVVRGGRPDIINETERQILLLASKGFFSKEIASKMNMNINTVKVHFQKIFDKLGASHKAHAVSQAIRKGII